MNRQLLIAVAVCLLILIAAFALGQQWTQQAIVTVSNEFVVGTTVLPAGTYSVRTPTASHNIVMLTNTETGASALATDVDIYNKAGNNEKTNFVFVRDKDGRQVLHQIWITGDTHGHDLIHEKGLPEPESH